ncbi:MAG TPA: hypothetical protein VGF99_17550 [Myxococcota bacterium]
MSVRRHRPAGIVPLEVWDVVVAGTPLHLQPSAAQPAAIAAIVQQLRDGAAIRKRGQALPALPIERVVVAGGGDVAAVVAAIAATGIEAHAATEPVHIGRVGGLELVRDLHGDVEQRDVLVVDVGQTSIKWFVNGRTERVARPAELLLEVDARASRDDVDWRGRCVAFIAGTIRSSFLCMTNDVRRPAAIVLALPCEIDGDDDVASALPVPPLPSGRGGKGVRQGSEGVRAVGVEVVVPASSQDGLTPQPPLPEGRGGAERRPSLRVAGCSYPWPDHDPHLIADILAAADVVAVPAVVLNDAELAAVSVRVAGFGVGTLVLTIGLGVGGAFIAA